MTAPTPTARATPDGVFLDDGFSTLVTFASNPNINFWEKVVQPPGVDGGDPIETSTMHNTTWRTMAARSLLTLTPFTITAAYDPHVYTDIIALINVPDTITVTFSDTDTIAFYAILQTFEPQDAEEGSQPEATLTIVPTNTDPVTGSEEAPVITATTGT